MSLPDGGRQAPRLNALLTLFGNPAVISGPADRAAGVDAMQTFLSDPHAVSSIPGPADTVLAWKQASAGTNGADAWFDLGVALSTGSRGHPCDLIEAHKWFNIAASFGHAEGAQCRADLAAEMTAREIADAQRRAREWLRRKG